MTKVEPVEYLRSWAELSWAVGAVLCMCESSVRRGSVSSHPSHKLSPLINRLGVKDNGETHASEGSVDASMHGPAHALARIEAAESSQRPI